MLIVLINSINNICVNEEFGLFELGFMMQLAHFDLFLISELPLKVSGRLQIQDLWTDFSNQNTVNSLE